jgi:glycosyltransferase involved in cell wall biosynthesis
VKISIITVALNSAATIEETILSVQRQTHADREHIVIDGGSRDGTLDLINRHRQGIAISVSEPDAGIFDAMNKGLARATGDVVGFLNADDVYANDQVLARIAAAFGDQAVDAVYADLVYVDRFNPEKVVRYWRSGDFQPGSFARGWMPAHPTFYVRRKVYERLGGFDLKYPLQGDFELTLRFLEVHRIRTRHIAEIWVRMRTGGASNRSVRAVLRGNVESYRAARANGLKVTPLFILRKILSRLPQFFARPA